MSGTARVAAPGALRENGRRSIAVRRFRNGRAAHGLTAPRHKGDAHVLEEAPEEEGPPQPRGQPREVGEAATMQTFEMLLYGTGDATSDPLYDKGG
ncbi:hypothetical protein, partial [Streptomyces fungicidicus]